MKIQNNIAVVLLFGFILFIVPELANAHIKWFVAFDIKDPPTSIITWLSRPYFYIFFLLSIFGVVMASLLDSYWCKTYGPFTLFKEQFSHYEDISLSIIRIGTAIFFIGLWLVGGVILTPETTSDASFIPYLHLLIPFALVFRRTLPVAAIAILVLYLYGVYLYGIFHMLDYLTIVGIAVYLVFSCKKSEKLSNLGLTILYSTLVFAFLWSAIEKLAYPQWFYNLLENEIPFITLGFENDIVIAGATFVEFTLFFLLLRNSNGVILIAFLCNALISAGNVYFGTMDVIGHFPVNMVLLVMLLRGPLEVKTLLFDHSCKPYSAAKKSGLLFLISIIAMISLYYGLHWVLY